MLGSDNRVIVSVFHPPFLHFSLPPSLPPSPGVCRSGSESQLTQLFQWQNKKAHVSMDSDTSSSHHHTSPTHNLPFPTTSISHSMVLALTCEIGEEINEMYEKRYCLSYLCVCSQSIHVHIRICSKTLIGMHELQGLSGKSNTKIYSFPRPAGPGGQ